jgi:hypothetical protein
VHSQETGGWICCQEAIAWNLNADDLQTVWFPKRPDGGTRSSANLERRQDIARKAYTRGHRGRGEKLAYESPRIAQAGAVQSKVQRTSYTEMLVQVGRWWNLEGDDAWA